MASLITLSKSDVEVLRELIAWYRDGGAPTVNRDVRDLDILDQPAPGTYIARVPSGGLAAMTGVVPGVASCPLYRLLPDTGSGAELEAVSGSEQTVYNATNVAFAEDDWIEIHRERFGAWFATPVSFSSGLTSPLTTKGDVWVYSTLNTRLPVGSNGQVITADSTNTLGMKWATPTTFTSPLSAKGDIYIRTSTIDFRLPVGTNGQIITADSTQSTGLKWVDKTYPVASINSTSLTVDTSTGLFITNPSGSVAQINLTAASRTAPGVLTAISSGLATAQYIAALKVIHDRNNDGGWYYTRAVTPSISDNSIGMTITNFLRPFGSGITDCHGITAWNPGGTNSLSLNFDIANNRVILTKAANTTAPKFSIYPGGTTDPVDGFTGTCTVVVGGVNKTMTVTGGLVTDIS